MPSPNPLPTALDSIDSPSMRRAGRELLSLALMDARNHTLHLMTCIAQASGAAAGPLPVVPETSRPLWLAGHIGWFPEFWIGRNTQAHLGPACPARPTRLASIEADADRWWSFDTSPSATQWALDLPDLAATKGYLLETLESSLSLLEKTPEDDDALYFFRLALVYEDRCGEELITLAQALGLTLPLDAPVGLTVREPLAIPATRWMLGSPRGGFVLDNEQWAHEIAVPEFEIDAQPVTWAQFVEFVDDGGYDRDDLWQPAGWDWLQEQEQREGRRGPRYVEQIGVARQGSGGAVLQTRFGKPTRMAGNQLAMHLSWWEADAWTRWAGRRLPTEVEWEIAAHTAVRRGFRWGDVHEWMANTLRPWPGFSPGPWDSYSAPWFGRA
ncbi:MAG TPA: SUMF1/EgtB/PvdO family nonheme iron enzyme, partial [Burkholderiaceae bacterium]|nr:SUMF1/EgtB/PvdO family nonheme iron enzyme [Burkholderiaceae bacterium]